MGSSLTGTVGTPLSYIPLPPSQFTKAWAVLFPLKTKDRFSTLCWYDSFSWNALGTGKLNSTSHSIYAGLDTSCFL
ncbi:hypothetical protein XENTR_v10004289 [Xenopus tropicalis]|nr:hypothetical protein XENTR_v10004289 [Xenopus tropicalis]